MQEPVLEETHVVTCFLRHRGEVLLLRRSEEVGSYRGRWGAVAGHAEGDPDAAARTEIEEETGLGDAVTLLRAGEPFAVEDAELGKRWIVHPYLFDCRRREARIDWESREAEWVAPTEILRRDCVPDLWTSYRRVAPRPADVADDRTHGSAWISLRALEVLRDRAGELAAGADASAQGDAAAVLRRLARDLLAARPAMAALGNRVSRAMQAARQATGERYAATVERAAHAGIAAALDADAEAARRAGELASGATVLTLSRSGTVSDALLAADPPPRRVLVAASAPQREGVAVAEELAAAGLAVTLLPDAAVASALLGRLEGSVAPRPDLVLLGADTVRADGSVVNKIGSLPAALAAHRAGVAVYAVAATDKVAPAGEVAPCEGDRGAAAAAREAGDEADLYAGSAPLDLANPLFEAVPADLVTAVVGEEGLLGAAQVGTVAARHAEMAEWDD